MFEYVNTPISPIVVVSPATPPNRVHTSATSVHRSDLPFASLQFNGRNLMQNVLITNAGNAKPESVSPILLDGSFDSGIGVETNEMELQRKLKDYKRILALLERDKEMYQLFRERLSKIIEKKHKKQQQEQQQQQQKDVNCCNVCGVANASENASGSVLCGICQKTVCCNTKCVQWQPVHARWECQRCGPMEQSLAHTNSWVFNQQKFNGSKKSGSAMHEVSNGEHDDNQSVFESVSQVGESGSNATLPIGEKETRFSVNSEQKLKIREYIEEVVAQMLGGSLDNVAVGQISKSENYLPKLINGNHEPNGNNVPNNNHNNETTFIDLSQTRLRQLIETIIAEALRLPLTLSSNAVSEMAIDTQSNSERSSMTQIKGNGDAKLIRNKRIDHYFEPKIYQELLATAVLNKIADTHGNMNNLFESSADLVVPDTNQNFKDNRSSSSGSSGRPRSDLSLTDNDQMLNLSVGEDDFDSHPSIYSDVITKSQLVTGRESALSDYIASHTIPLPNFSATATESEEDADCTSVTSSQIGDGNWENNWLLKKKHSHSLSSSVTAGSVGMLVPAPKDDVRAQIGDKIADETSDLSEMGSDTDSSLELIHNQLDPLNDRLLNKHLIGGKNTKLALDELIEGSSTEPGTSATIHEPTCTETANELLCNQTTKIEAINDAISDAFNEMRSLENSPENILHQSLTHYDDNGNRRSNLEADAENPIAGSIAEREYKKWYNAVDMPNNPYSPEALQQRISGSKEKYIDIPNINPSTELNPISMIERENGLESEVQKEQLHEREYKRYSRDYYINDNKSSASSTKPKASDFTQHQADSSNSNESDEVAKKIAKIMPQENIYQALPAQVIEDSTSFETQSTISNQSIQSQTTTTTSDDADTIRIYDFKNQETTVIRETSRENTSPNSASLEKRSTKLTRQKPCSETAQPKERPTELLINRHSDNADNETVKKSAPIAMLSPSSTIASNRGSTPTAFKFLQPKRKLINPNQVLSFEEEDMPQVSSVERSPIEDEVAHALPSVKALAQAFLMTSHKGPQTSNKRRWSTKVTTPEPVKSPPTPSVPTRKLEPAPSLAEIADDATIASDLSSLETDPLVEHGATDTDVVDALETTALDTTNSVPVRSGFLQSNIAFFENLKFK